MAPISISIPRKPMAAIISILLVTSCSSATVAHSETLVGNSRNTNLNWRLNRHQNTLGSARNKNNRNSNHKIGHRNLVRGEAWVSQQQKGRETDTIGLQNTGDANKVDKTDANKVDKTDETDNVFVHDKKDDECACDRRQRRHLETCICDSDIHIISASNSKGKGSKSYSYYGKGSGKGSSSHSGYGKGGSSSSSSSKGAKSSKSEKSYGKGYGKGYPGYDDDYTYPTSQPIVQPAGPSVPTFVPTQKVTQPSPRPQNGRQPSAAPVPKTPTQKPTSRPTKATPNCVLDKDGLYGKKLGVSSQFVYQYYTTVIPLDTVEELNVDMLPKMERAQGKDLLPKLFAEECASAATVKKTRNSNGRRNLQGGLGSLNGMTIKPRDTVVENAKCQGVDTTMFPCYVVKGGLTVFSSTNLDTITRFQIENMISQSFSAQGLVQTDPRFLTISFKKFLEPPPPVTPPPTKSPTNSPGGGGGGWFFDLAWWILALIALGGIFVLVFLLICVTRCCRRRRIYPQSPANPQQRPPDVEQVVPVNDGIDGMSSSSSSSNTSIASSERNLGAQSNGYQYHSDDQINDAMVPNIADPIVEERQEDLSSGRATPNLYQPLPVDRYNGVSYEDRMYSNMPNPYQNPNDYTGTSSEYIDITATDTTGKNSLDRETGVGYETGGGDSTDHSRSRSLSRMPPNQEFRNLDGRMNQSPRKISNGTPPSIQSSDIHSATSRQMSYGDEGMKIVDSTDDEDDSYEDVEEDYEIEYASQSERQETDPNQGFYEEVWVDENDPATSNSNTNSNTNHNTTDTNSQSNSYSGSRSSYGSDKSPDSRDQDPTPLAFSAYNAQLQQQQLQKNQPGSSFDSLRQKWEQT